MIYEEKLSSATKSTRPDAIKEMKMEPDETILDASKLILVRVLVDD